MAPGTGPILGRPTAPEDAGAAGKMSLFRRNRAREAAGEPDADATAQLDVDVTHEHEPGGRAPAELDALVGEAPATRRRGRLRRRLRHLRRVREVLLRDLGGLTFEMHRSGEAGASPALDGKLARLALVDAEIRDLEQRLDDHRAMVVREPGIGGTCAECGELFGSEARYCWACGNPVAPGAGGAPHLAGWTTLPQLTAAPQPKPAAPLASPAVEGSWVDHPTEPLTRQDEPTAEQDVAGAGATDPVPQMDPAEAAAAAEEPAANEPATGDVGGEQGAEWGGSAPRDDAPAISWLPPQEQEETPPLSSGDPLGSPPGNP